jgi:biopolymer transport protein ExbB
MKTLLYKATIAVSLIAVSTPWAQYSEDDNTDRIQALKIELEEKRNLRDRVLAKRWSDKQEYNDARELFNQEYDELKDKLNVANSRREQLQEEMAILLQEVEKLKAKQESEKIKFLGLSFQQKGVIQDLSQKLEKRFPTQIPQRQKAINVALKSVEEKKDRPEDVLKDVTTLLLKELELTRKVTLQQGSLLLADYSPGTGSQLQVGTIAAAYLDTASQRTGLLLRNSNLSGRLYEWREDLMPSAKEALQETFTSSDKTPLTLPMDVLRVRAVGAGYTEDSDKGFFGSIIGYFRDGGLWMLPLGLIALAALTLLIERGRYWWLRRLKSQEEVERALQLIRDNKLEDAHTLCGEDSQSPIFNALKAVLNSKVQNKSRDQAEKELQEALLQEAPKLEKRLATISVLGAAAPLLGLLGTVAGMIQLFEAITLYGTSDPKLMAGGISVALITTQMGLAVSVPIMVCHNFISNRIDTLIQQMEHHSLRALNLIWPHG